MNMNICRTDASIYIPWFKNIWKEGEISILISLDFQTGDGWVPPNPKKEGKAFMSSSGMVLSHVDLFKLKCLSISLNETDIIFKNIGRYVNLDQVYIQKPRDLLKEI